MVCEEVKEEEQKSEVFVFGLDCGYVIGEKVLVFHGEMWNIAWLFKL